MCGHLLEVFLKSKHNRFERPRNITFGDPLMNGLSGMEKFSHLEDKIYLTIEFAKKMREEKEKVERETSGLRREISSLAMEKARLEEKIEDLLSERDAIQLKVEAMLDAMTIIDAEVAEAVGRAS